jgi:poly-gamma-glutamate capsule biosynthesis protein CapA/YwtB (metallophosphatase superfamily)
MNDKDLLLGFVGDLLVDREQPNEPFANVHELLHAPDIMFGNLEGPYTDHPHSAPSVGIPVIPTRHNVSAFGPAGFDVLSCANNHIVDAGHEAMLQTLADVRAQGIATCGAGNCLAAARVPAVLERDGYNVAYLAYASVFPMGYEARSDVPGLAPARAYNHFHEAYPNYHIPGTQGRVETIPDEIDMANLLADIEVAREKADIVVASFHWGDYLRAFHLTDHEKRTARYCIEHGADLVVGHHQHMLRGMEWVAGKPVLYGLGHFVFDLQLKITAELKMILAKLPADSYHLGPRDGWPLLPMHADARMTFMAWAQVRNRRITGIGFVPCRLRPDGRVQAVSPESGEGREVIAYIEKCQSTQGLNGRIEGDGPLIGGHASLRVVPLF